MDKSFYVILGKRNDDIAISESVLEDLENVQLVNFLVHVLKEAKEQGKGDLTKAFFLFPEELAERLKTTKRTVERYISILKKKGYLKQVKERRRAYVINEKILQILEEESEKQEK